MNEHKDLHGDTAAFANGHTLVDLDGTLAFYDGWKGPEHIGEPIPKMVERVKGWLAEGRDVRIFTARAYPGKDDTDVCRAAIDKWINKVFGRSLPITHEKTHRTYELWDDRAIEVVANTGMTRHEFDKARYTGTA
jgi:hypothetical protein